MTPHLTPKEIEERFEDAARTLRRLPEDGRPQGYFNTWPQIIRTAWEVMAMEKQPMKFCATPRSITRMEECFDWMFWLEPDDARIVWMRAEGTRWRAICRRLGISRMTAWRRWASALILVSNRLKNPTPMGRARQVVKGEAARDAPRPRATVE